MAKHQREVDQIGRAHDARSMAGTMLTLFVLAEQPWVTQAGKPDLPSQDAKKPALTPEPEAKPAGETPEISAPTKPLTKQSPFFGLLRAEEVAAVYTSIEARGLCAQAPSEF